MFTVKQTIVLYIIIIVSFIIIISGSSIIYCSFSLEYLFPAIVLFFVFMPEIRSRL